MRQFRRPYRLLFRVYAVGLLHLALVVCSFFIVIRSVISHSFSRPPMAVVPAVAIIHELSGQLDDPAALEASMRLLGKSGLDVSLYRPSGEPIPATSTRRARPLGSQAVETLMKGETLQLSNGGSIAVPLMADGRVIGYGLVDRAFPFGAHDHPPPLPLPFYLTLGIALFAITIVSILFARSLVRPLERLVTATRAFGAGDLKARANVRRNDEIGEVARTFDETADRVNALMSSQREFLANVSHELRTPLARIRCALDIADEAPTDGDARKAIAEIDHDWHDLDKLVEELLTATRLELAANGSSVAPLRREPIDVVTLSQQALDRAQSLFSQHQFKLDCRPVRISVDGDPSLLRRVLDNLLTNAAKYSDAGSTVDLIIRHVGDGVEIRVEDHGIGIEPSDLPHIFTPFFRTDRSRARATGGFGLGLALAKRIVEAHGGSMRLQSRLSVGTTVSFSIPAQSGISNAPAGNSSVSANHSPCQRG